MVHCSHSKRLLCNSGRRTKTAIRNYLYNTETRVEKYRDIFENIKNIENMEKSDFIDIFDIFYIYRAYAHTLLTYKIYYQIVVCVCVLCILGEVLSLFTLHCCGEVQSDRSCPTLRKC